MRLPLAQVETMMAGRASGASLEEVLEVFEVFASSSLTDEVYILEPDEKSPEATHNQPR